MNPPRQSPASSRFSKLLFFVEKCDINAEAIISSLQNEQLDFQNSHHTPGKFCVDRGQNEHGEEERCPERAPVHKGSDSWVDGE